jgi:hypothetical protein
MRSTGLHEFNELDRVGVGGRKNSLVMLAVINVVSGGGAGGESGKDGGECDINWWGL